MKSSAVAKLSSAPSQSSDLTLAAEPAHSLDRAVLAQSLSAVLGQVAHILDALAPAHYRQPSADTFMRATIGAHVRHILDHVAPIIDLADGALLNYDHRTRLTQIERDPQAASAELARLLAALARPDALSTKLITVSVIAAGDAPPVMARSTIERELAFALSHTIHHGASIRGILLGLGLAAPATLGYAPSTLAHKAGSSCVR